MKADVHIGNKILIMPATTYCANLVKEVSGKASWNWWHVSCEAKDSQTGILGYASVGIFKLRIVESMQSYLL